MKTEFTPPDDPGQDEHAPAKQTYRSRTALEITALRADPKEWELSRSDPYKASPESFYERYTVTVDSESGDRATEIKLFQTARPHMRSLHCAWISFFLAFAIWFAPAPLLQEIKLTLGLSKKEVWTASITNDCTAIVMRIIVGPLCDQFGARIPMAVVLCLASIPTAMVGLVESATGLALIRMFIGLAGSSFVMAQFWPSRMFSREIAGTANGLVGGWGNLGGAFTQVFMGSVLFPLFKSLYEDENSEAVTAEKSWRKICVIPALAAFIWGLILPWISDDAPMGNYGQMRKTGSMDRIFFTTALRRTATINTWILYVQYACSFGVELVMNNGAVLYFTSEYGLITERAATLGFIYSSMNIFARALGGLASDRLNLAVGMRGRLWLITILLLLEGAMIIVFAFTQSLEGSIVVMCIFSLFTQAAEGAIYGVVPYVSKLYTGSVAGLVGAGGNAGSVVYGFGFRSLPYRDAFVMMGAIVMASSFLSVFIRIPTHAGLISGEDNHQVILARERFMAQRERDRMYRGDEMEEDEELPEDPPARMGPPPPASVARLTETKLVPQPPGMVGPPPSRTRQPPLPLAPQQPMVHPPPSAMSSVDRAVERERTAAAVGHLKTVRTEPPPPTYTTTPVAEPSLSPASYANKSSNSVMGASMTEDIVEEGRSRMDTTATTKVRKQPDMV